MPLPVHTRAPPCPGPAFGAAPLLPGGQVSQGPPQTPEIAPQAPRAPSFNLGPGASETTVRNPQAPQHGSLPTPQEAAPRLLASAPSSPGRCELARARGGPGQQRRTEAGTRREEARTWAAARGHQLRVLPGPGRPGSGEIWPMDLLCSLGKPLPLSGPGFVRL